MFSTNRRNCILTKTDSYKLLHWKMYPQGTQHVYSYLESRKGAKFPYTVFCGLQYLLKEYLAGPVVTQEKIDWARSLTTSHLGLTEYFNNVMWPHILNNWSGRLPITIKAVPEGTPVPVNNALMTIVNNDPVCAPLTNALESLLTHVWHPSTVATSSRETFKMIKKYLAVSSDNMTGLKFMLHDFGYRGCSSDESSSLGGFGHLVNGFGTDTVPAMEIAMDFYNEKNIPAYSVPATEHSIMTSRGRNGEAQVVSDLLDQFPVGILSVVSDSYDIYNFVKEYVCKQFRDRIMARKPDALGNCAFVVRPDSVTPIHPHPEDQVLWILDTLMTSYPHSFNSKGKIVLDKHVRVLWGDGIDSGGIERILCAVVNAGYSAENLVFGMGGGLLQKINRDTQRFAFKSSAQCRDGVWHDIFKEPLDKSKESKKGMLKLVRRFGSHCTVYDTVPWNTEPEFTDELVTVFENGEITSEQTLSDMRKRAELSDYPLAL